MRIAWLTDIHLNFLGAAKIADFLGQVSDQRPDAVLVGGDIAEAPTLFVYLEKIHDALTCPIYFVLGNHDYYFGSILRIREKLKVFCRDLPRLTWLGDASVVKLTDTVGLVGHDGWADARLGDYERSLVMMHDYHLIEELAGADKATRWPLLREMGDRVAEHVRGVLPRALAAFPHVFFLTHVPPFREACCYRGQISNDDWLPHFTCFAAGQAMLEIMRAFPERNLTVLCGHTHGTAECRPLANLRVITGGAEYGAPAIQPMLELD